MKVLELGANADEVAHFEDGVGSGEAVLLSFAPVFKRRYALDSDLVLGCTIGCRFCYYRMISSTRDFFGTGKLMRLASPEEFADVVEMSKIAGELVILGARGDGSMYPDEISEVAELVNAKILVLRRAPFDERVAEHLENGILYGTTITPMAAKTGTPVREEAQLRALEKYGDPEKVSVEVGPITLENAGEVEKIVSRLSEIGWKAAIYRGVSAGSFGIPRRKVIEELHASGFLTDEQRRKAENSKEYFYAIKNELSKEVEEKVVEIFKDHGLKAYRHTGLYYALEWGISVARNRNNAVRNDVFEAAPPRNPGREKVGRTFEEFGYEVKGVEKVRRGVYVVETAEPVTEDVAMAAGEFLGAAVIAKNYEKSPTLGTLRFYVENDLVHLPPKSRELVGRFLK